MISHGLHALRLSTGAAAAAPNASDNAVRSIGHARPRGTARADNGHAPAPGSSRRAGCAAFRRVEELGGLELVLGELDAAPGPVHSHAGYALITVEAGRGRFLAGRHVEDAGPGTMILLEPGVPYAGGSCDATPLRYRDLQVQPAMMCRALEGRGTPVFPIRIVPDVALSQRLAAMHERLMAADEPRRLEPELLAMLAEVVRRHGLPAAASTDQREPRRIRVIREHLASNLAAAPSLDELSDLVSVSPFYLQRTFKAVTRMSPREYLMDLRIRRARELLREGVAPRAVAASVGFFDQSHFTRAFRKLTGVTPGVYARSG